MQKCYRGNMHLIISPYQDQSPYHFLHFESIIIKQLHLPMKYLSVIIIMLILYLVASCKAPAKDREPAIHIVEIKQMEFIPAAITVKKGDSIIWINKDLVAHDVTEQKTKKWSSSLLQPGQSWKMTILESAEYYCSIHVVMKGKIISQ